MIFIIYTLGNLYPKRSVKFFDDCDDDHKISHYSAHFANDTVIWEVTEFLSESIFQRIKHCSLQ